MTPGMNFERLTEIAANTVGAAQRQLPPEIRMPAREVAVHYERAPADQLRGQEEDAAGPRARHLHGFVTDDRKFRRRTNNHGMNISNAGTQKTG